MRWAINAAKAIEKVELMLVRRLKGNDYAPCPPYGYATFSPWFAGPFRDLYDKIKNHTVVTEDRCYMIDSFVRHCLHLDGDFAECGVYKGGTAFLIANVLHSRPTADRQLHLFDTFTGMPATAKDDPSCHKPGDFGDASIDGVGRFLSPFPFALLHPGVIPASLEVVKDRFFAFVHVDVDLYRSVGDCCSFFYERMTSGGIMIFDDYGFDAYKFSAKKAVDEFFSNKEELPIPLRTGQCIVIKL